MPLFLTPGRCLSYQVEVSLVSVLELGQDFRVLAQENVTKVFRDGDSFMYKSIVADQVAGADVETPRVIQLNFFALNAENQPIVNFFAIAFSNDCSVYPVFEEGDTAGWTRFVSAK
jgi:hypothetical protein